MQAPDLTQPQPSGKINPIYLEGRALPLENVLARELNLKNGQIIQGRAELNGQSLKMLVNNKLIDLPPNMSFRPGDKVLLKAQAGPGFWMLRPIDPKLNKESNLTDIKLLPGIASRLQSLLLRPPMTSSLAALFQSDLISSILKRGSNPELLDIFQRLQLSIKGLSPNAIQNAVIGSGFWLESKLLKGQLQQSADIKVLLRRLIRSTFEKDSINKIAIERALDDIESSQIDSLASKSKGELSFSLILPFLDSNPLEIEFFRGAIVDEEDSPPFTVDIHTKNEILGEVWFKTTLSKLNDVDIMMWALKPDLASLANKNSDSLKQKMKEAGLNLVSFRVFETSRPIVPISWSNSPGKMLDIKA
tara:strand:+ start:2505 stop:3587 length:1083 start_codon:yes stop_codon:yes gene_type:complete